MTKCFLFRYGYALVQPRHSLLPLMAKVTHTSRHSPSSRDGPDPSSSLPDLQPLHCSLSQSLDFLRLNLLFPLLRNLGSFLPNPSNQGQETQLDRKTYRGRKASGSYHSPVTSRILTLPLQLPTRLESRELDLGPPLSTPFRTGKAAFLVLQLPAQRHHSGHQGAAKEYPPPSHSPTLTTPRAILWISQRTSEHPRNGFPGFSIRTVV